MSLTIPQIKRAVALADAGLSDAAVAAVLNLDYGVQVSGPSVRYYRYRHGGPRHPLQGRGLAGMAVDQGDNFGAAA